MRRRIPHACAVIACLGLGLGLLAAGLLGRGAQRPAPPAGAPAPAAPLPEAARRPAPPEVALPPAPEPASAPASASDLRRRLEASSRLADSAWLAERMREVGLQQQAQARWDEGVSREDLEARHVEPAVRRFFGELELEPLLRDGGLMDGLAIRRVAADGTAARAGLEPGDVIVRLLDEELADPAALPELLTRLPRRLPLCVRRAASTRCLELELD